MLMQSTAERRAHARGLIEKELVTECDSNSAPQSKRKKNGARQKVMRERFRDTCPLDRYFAKGKLSRRQWTAGCAFEALWRAAAGPSLGAINLAREIRGPYRERLPRFGFGSLSTLAARARLARREHDQAPLQWTPRGVIVRNVCVYGECLAGGKQLHMLAEGLEQFADVLQLEADPESPE